ncbi:methyltransferase domain-containing protein [Gillisia sp. JM1]|uniref:methyltransferase domain-containing protein n=1 Tax=Gillisia sp. JM1 TaxID=1283286 RepID=UPI0004246D87|nr:methyltransferase domain-containing protein [Gillisia sp. JM1]
MKNILKRIQNITLNIIRAFKEDRKYKKQAENTLELRKVKISDYERWKNTEELFVDWNQRTAILASMITKGANIIEFGAGNMALKNHIPPDCSYTPSDIYKRSEEMLECDLNSRIEFTLDPYDTAVFSGVFEYVYDVDKVFRQLSDSIDNVVLSYACSDVSNADRLRSGWLSDYSKKELEDIFEKYNYQIAEYKEWRNQSIYNLRQSSVK